MKKLLQFCNTVMNIYSKSNHPVDMDILNFPKKFTPQKSNGTNGEVNQYDDGKF